MSDMLSGQKVWILEDHGEAAFGNDEENYWGLAVIGVYTTRDLALAALRTDIVGDEKADRIEWTQSPNNPEHSTGWDAVDQEGFTLYSREIDAT